MLIPSLGFGSSADLGSPLVGIYNWVTGGPKPPSPSVLFPEDVPAPKAGGYAPPPGYYVQPQGQPTVLYPGLPGDPAENRPDGTPWYEDKRVLIGIGVGLLGMTAAFAFATRR